MEKCPRCGLMADAVKTIRAERMPGVNGANRFELVGHVYYHPSGLQCAVPRVGEAYTIHPQGLRIAQPVLGPGDAPIRPPNPGTGDGAIPAVSRKDLEYKQWEN